MDPWLVIIVILLLLSGGSLRTGHFPEGGENVIWILVWILIVVFLLRAIQNFFPPRRG